MKTIDKLPAHLRETVGNAFARWWVEARGRPPIADESELFDRCREHFLSGAALCISAVYGDGMRQRKVADLVRDAFFAGHAWRLETPSPEASEAAKIAAKWKERFRGFQERDPDAAREIVSTIAASYEGSKVGPRKAMFKGLASVLVGNSARATGLLSAAMARPMEGSDDDPPEQVFSDLTQAFLEELPADASQSSEQGTTCNSCGKAIPAGDMFTTISLSRERERDGAFDVVHAELLRVECSECSAFRGCFEGATDIDVRHESVRRLLEAALLDVSPRPSPDDGDPA